MGLASNVSVVVVALLAVAWILTREPTEQLPPSQSPSSLPIGLERWKQRGSLVTLPDIGGHGMWTVDERGSGHDTLVIMHGFPTSTMEWEHCLPHLKPRFLRIVLADHIGFGFSSKPRAGANFSYSIQDHADAALELLSLIRVQGPVHFLCHDLGDSICMEIISRISGLPKAQDAFPFVVKSVTFLNGGIRIAHANFRLSQILLRLPFVGSILQGAGSFWVWRWQMKTLEGTPGALDDQFLLDAFEQSRLSNGKYRLTEQITYIDDRYRHESRWWRNLLRWQRKGAGRVMLIWGGADAVAPVAIYEEAVGLLGKSTVSRVLPNLGHWLMQEDPKRVSETYLSMLRE